MNVISNEKLSIFLILFSLFGAVFSTFIADESLRQSIKLILFIFLLLGVFAWFSKMHKKYHAKNSHQKNTVQLSVWKITLILVAVLFFALILIEILKFTLIFYEIL